MNVSFYEYCFVLAFLLIFCTGSEIKEIKEKNQNAVNKISIQDNFIYRNGKAIE